MQKGLNDGLWNWVGERSFVDLSLDFRLEKKNSQKGVCMYVGGTGGCFKML